MSLTYLGCVVRLVNTDPFSEGSISENSRSHFRCTGYRRYARTDRDQTRKLRRTRRSPLLPWIRCPVKFLNWSRGVDQEFESLDSTRAIERALSALAESHSIVEHFFY